MASLLIPALSAAQLELSDPTSLPRRLAPPAVARPGGRRPSLVPSRNAPELEQPAFVRRNVSLSRRRPSPECHQPSPNLPPEIERLGLERSVRLLQGQGDDAPVALLWGDRFRFRLLRRIRVAAARGDGCAAPRPSSRTRARWPEVPDSAALTYPAHDGTRARTDPGPARIAAQTLRAHGGRTPAGLEGPRGDLRRAGARDLSALAETAPLLRLKRPLFGAGLDLIHFRRRREIQLRRGNAVLRAPVSRPDRWRRRPSGGRRTDGKVDLAGRRKWIAPKPAPRASSQSASRPGAGGSRERPVGPRTL